jgi:hypothetical protein
MVLIPGYNPTKNKNKKRRKKRWSDRNITQIQDSLDQAGCVRSRLIELLNIVCDKTLYFEYVAGAGTNNIDKTPERRKKDNTISKRTADGDDAQGFAVRVTKLKTREWKIIELRYLIRDFKYGPYLKGTSNNRDHKFAIFEDRWILILKPNDYGNLKNIQSITHYTLLSIREILEEEKRTGKRIIVKSESKGNRTRFDVKKRTDPPIPIHGMGLVDKPSLKNAILQIFEESK